MVPLVQVCVTGIVLTYFLNGSVLGAGVLYKMLVTASSALGARGCENAGSGGGALRLLVSLSV
jgi:hypothetical protein